MVAGVDGDGRALMKFLESRKAPLALTSYRCECLISKCRNINSILTEEASTSHHWSGSCSWMFPPPELTA